MAQELGGWVEERCLRGSREVCHRPWVPFSLETGQTLIT
jgi:hypothetical protein